MTIGWALLGPGRHAERFVVPEMKQAAGSKLVAVLSRDQQRAEGFAGKHGFDRAYDSLDSLLDDPDVDAIYDASPDGLHGSNVIRVAEAGKHILVEKPLAISVDECHRAIQACRQHEVKLGVVFQERHQPANKEARRIVLTGGIGELLAIQVHLAVAAPAPPTTDRSAQNWRMDQRMRPGGIVMGVGDHGYDTMRYIAGQEVLEVTAFTDSTSDVASNERTAQAMLKMDGGCVGYLLVTRRAPFPQVEIIVHGTEGTLVCSNTFSFLARTGRFTGQPRLEMTTTKGATVQEFAAANCFTAEIESFNRAIAMDDEPITSGQGGLINQAINEAIYESNRTGRVTRVSASR